MSPPCAAPSPLKLEREQGLSYDPDREILITDGATLGLFAALGALVDQKRSVMLPDPIYDAYEGPIALWGGSPAPVHAALRDGRFTFGSRQLEDAWVTGTDVILLNTPWNPVGTVLDREELVDIMGFAEKNDYLVISDEIYESLVYDGRRHVSPASVSADARERTILINSLSKTYAMTGWRVGYCAGPEAIIRAMLLVLQQSSRGPATFVQDAAACALTSDQECTRRMAAEYQGRRDRVVERLARHSGRRAARARGGIVRDGRRPRPGEAVRRRSGGSCCVKRASSCSTARLTVRAEKDSCASHSPRGARCSSAVSSGCATGCCDSRPRTPPAGEVICMSLTELPVIDALSAASRSTRGRCTRPLAERSARMTCGPIASAGRSTQPTPASTRSFHSWSRFPRRPTTWRPPCECALSSACRSRLGAAVPRRPGSRSGRCDPRLFEALRPRARDQSDERWARVEPGCVLDDLNLALKPHGLQFAPDISTSNRATIGGMIANNSSGARSVLYGKTIDHVLELKIVLSDGSLVHLKPLDGAGARGEMRPTGPGRRLLPRDQATGRRARRRDRPPLSQDPAPRRRIQPR